MSARIDFKFRSIIRNGIETIATVAFYTGDDVEAVDELTGEPVTVYRRSARVRERVLTVRGTVSDDDLRAVLNERLKTLRDTSYPTREILAEQVVTRESTVQPTSERSR